jgi:hypothetical protein
MAYTTIDDPSVYFQTALWTGNGSSQSITNDGNSDLQPDWVWTKCRSVAFDPYMRDTSRGISKKLLVHATDAESSGSGTTSFNSDGFTVDSTNQVNRNSDTYVAWQWKANGGTTSSNSDGSITSTVQANTTAGFSIVTYTGTGSNATVGHGLGSSPKIVIVKRRDNARGWRVGGEAIGTTNQFLGLNNTNAFDSATSGFRSFSSTTFGIGTSLDWNVSSSNFIAYCFAEKQGYSKFGSYIANNSTDGPFVYLGFKPAWIMVKNTSTASDFPITDNKREAGNPFGEEMLFANANDAETSYSGGGIDFLSNGFKIRSTGTNGVHNANNTSHKFIYMAFAESPFVSSKGVPTTAR